MQLSWDDEYSLIPDPDTNWLSEPGTGQTMAEDDTWSLVSCLDTRNKIMDGEQYVLSAW